MKQLLILAAVSGFLFLTACEEGAKNREQITEFERILNTYREDPTRGNADSLTTYLLGNPHIFEEEPEKAEIGIEVAAEAYIRESVRKLFIHYLKARDYSEIPDALLFLASVHEEQLADSRVANYFYLNFVEEFPDDPRWDSIESKLPEQWTTTEELIAEEGRGIYSRDGTILNRGNANNFMLLAELYAIAKPESPKAPDYLFQAAEVAKSFELYDRSIFNSRWVIDGFPEHEMASNALFFKAFTIDESGVNQKRAHELFEKFLARYPEHPFAESAEVLKQKGAYSDDQLLEMLRSTQ